MKTKRLKCPYCDAAIEADISGRTSVFCSYCGQQVQLDDEKQEFTYNKNINITKTSHKRYTDDAEVIKETNRGKEDKRSWIAFSVILAIFFGMPLIWSCVDAIKTSAAKNEGKVNAGYYENLLGEDYKTVEAHFKAAGFTNIELIDLDDSGIAFWSDGKVKNISVGGDTSFDSGDWFDPNTTVVISYH